MSKYRLKPIIVDAFKWTGDHNQAEDPEWIVKAIDDGSVSFSHKGTRNVKMLINNTLAETLYAHRGEYIVKDANGELSSCESKAFEAIYELAVVDDRVTLAVAKEFRLTPLADESSDEGVQT